MLPAAATAPWDLKLRTPGPSAAATATRAFAAFEEGVQGEVGPATAGVVADTQGNGPLLPEGRGPAGTRPSSEDRESRVLIQLVGRAPVEEGPSAATVRALVTEGRVPSAEVRALLLPSTETRALLLLSEIRALLVLRGAPPSTEVRLLLTLEGRAPVEEGPSAAPAITRAWTEGNMPSTDPRRLLLIKWRSRELRVLLLPDAREAATARREGDVMVLLPVE